MKITELIPIILKELHSLPYDIDETTKLSYAISKTYEIVDRELKLEYEQRFMSDQYDWRL